MFAFPLGEKISPVSSWVQQVHVAKCPCQVYVAEIHVKCIRQRSMSGVCGKDLYKVYVAKIHVKCMWQKSMSSVYGKDQCQVYVAKV